MKSKNTKNTWSIFYAVISICVALFTFTGCSQQVNTVEEAHKINGTEAIPYTEQEETSKPSGELVVRFVDVGQGDSAIVTCDGHNLLIDGGSSKASSTVYSSLQQLGINYLDYIIITHTDADHCGGVAGALNYATCGTCYCSQTTANTETWNNVIKYLNNQGKSITVPNVNQELSLGNAKITILGPTKHFSEDNNNSVVCRIDYGNNSFLFTGDAEEDAENSLISSGCNLKADVLKVSHHGSNHCSKSNFINKVMPKYSIISVGKNSYGHPSNDVISRLSNVGSSVYRTDESGNITVKSDGTNLSIETKKGSF